MNDFLDELDVTNETTDTSETNETGFEEIVELKEEPVKVDVETTAITTVVTKEHAHISDAFLDRVREIISRRGLQIKNYGLKVSQGPWDTNDEHLALQIDENTVLNITLGRKSS